MSPGDQEGAGQGADDHGGGVAVPRARNDLTVWLFKPLSAQLGFLSTTHTTTRGSINHTRCKRERPAAAQPPSTAAVYY